MFLRRLNIAPFVVVSVEHAGINFADNHPTPLLLENIFCFSPRFIERHFAPQPPQPHRGFAVSHGAPSSSLGRKYEVRHGHLLGAHSWTWNFRSLNVADMNSVHGAEKAEELQEPEDDSDDHHDIDDLLDFPVHGDEGVHEIEQNTNNDQDDDEANERHGQLLWVR